MKVKSATKEYKVVFENSLSFLNRLAVYDNAFYAIDRKVWSLYRGNFEEIPSSRLILVDATEENKIIETALMICDRMVGLSAKRNAHLVSIGGGIIQDITGFAANVLYRGISWTFVPTTLLSACDSCIGGKTSLNYKRYKNLLGTFYPPDEIIICPVFFSTLSKVDLESGLGEVVKFNVMAGEEKLKSLESSLPGLLSLDPDTTNGFVQSSLAYKKAIIEEDEFDRGHRVLLNFAHTFGHAFEVSSDYLIPHGSAVALGLIAANGISKTRGMLDESLDSRIRDVVACIMPAYDASLISFDVVLSAIRQDKKQIGQAITAILLDSDFELHVVHDVLEPEVQVGCQNAIDFLKSQR